MNDLRHRGLASALAELADYPVLATAVGSMRSDVARINETLRQTIVEQIPGFTESSNPQLLPSLQQHIARHTAEILRLLAGGLIGEFEFVREHANQRAEQFFPLEATLHAYRCGHRVYASKLRDALVATATDSIELRNAVGAAADFAIEYTDATSTIAAGAYIARTRMLADVAGDQRAELLKILLEGFDEADGRVAGLLRKAGYLDQRQSYCVAVAQSVEPSEMQQPARARRIVESLDELLANQPGRRLIDVRDNTVVAICSDTRRMSGWTAARASQALHVAESLRLAGPAVLIGVSNDVPSTSQIPAAFREATLALEIASVSNRVAQISDVSMHRLMLHLSADELKKAMPAWADEFLNLSPRQQGVMVATLRAYANANMNLLQTAADLTVHPNTIYARFKRISDLTGQDPRTFNGLNELLVVSDCAS